MLLNNSPLTLREARGGREAGTACQDSGRSIRLELPTLNLDRAPETHVEFRHLTRRDPQKRRMHMRADHPPPGDNPIEIVFPRLVVSLTLNDRLERVAIHGARATMPRSAMSFWLWRLARER